MFGNYAPIFNLRIIFVFFSFIPRVLAQMEHAPLVNYSTLDYNGENQNWSISQNNQQEIFVANNAGLLVFNSESWVKYESPNGSILRSVKVINEKVYTGCYMEFGFWVKNEFGNLVYTSLSKKISSQIQEDEQFWEILSLDGNVYFQSLNRIYIFTDGGELKHVITSTRGIYKSFLYKGSIFFQVFEEGLYKIEKDKKKLVISQDKLKETLINRLVAINGKTLIVTKDQGFLQVSGNDVSNWNSSLNITLRNLSIYTSLELADGSICLGTISNGAYLISKNGDGITRINQKTGLPNNTVLSLFEDKGHNVWLGLDNGLSIFNNSSPIRVFYDVEGELGTIYDAVLHDGFLYLGTNQGLFYRKYGSVDPFQLIKNTKGQVWALKKIDNQLLCCHHKGLFLIKNNIALPKKIGIGIWDVKKLKDSIYVAGTYEGLYVLVQDYQVKNKIEGFDISSRYFEFIDEKNVFVNHEYKGVFNLTLSPNFKKVSNISINKSVPKGRKSGLIAYNNQIFYFFDGGLYKCDKLGDSFRLDQNLGNIFLKNEGFTTGKLTEANGKLWGFTKKNLVFIEANKNGYSSNKIPFSDQSRNDIAGFEKISFLTDNIYLLGLAKGYMLLNLDEINPKPLRIYLNSIKASEVDKPARFLSISQPKSLDYTENNLSFHFSSVNFDKFTKPSYRFQLVNYNLSYSDWSDQTQEVFKNLPPGDYIFKAQSKIGGVQSDNELSYEFTIKRPWYYSNLMLLFYVLALLLAFILIHLSSRRYFKNQQRKVLEKKRQELALAKLESEREIIALRNKKLLQENESKTRELASSTLSLAKNNEVLISIREELNQQQQGKELKSIFEIIDKNLHKESSWELFQDAFNNTDKDFLKKLSERHPNLTPNDLRLAAYLRLNLASKEVAPLLNISYKSVEIKRYRLRKKMKLKNAENLVQYILDI